MRETSESIGEWAMETFGPVASGSSVVARALKEFSELATQAAASPHDFPEELAEECADVTIVLARLADLCGFDLFERVDTKMAINREREWVLDENGHGQHIEEEPNR